MPYVWNSLIFVWFFWAQINKGLKDSGRWGLSLGLTDEMIKVLLPKLKKTEQTLKGGTNQIEMAELLEHDIVKEHAERLREQLFQLDKLHSAARLFK